MFASIHPKTATERYRARKGVPTPAALDKAGGRHLLADITQEWKLCGNLRWTVKSTTSRHPPAQKVDGIHINRERKNEAEFCEGVEPSFAFPRFHAKPEHT